MQDAGLRLIRNLLEEKNWNILNDNGIIDSDFVAKSKDTINELRKYHEKYGEFPPIDIFENNVRNNCKIKDFKLPELISKEVSLDLFLEEKGDRDLNNYIKTLRAVRDNHGRDAAFDFIEDNSKIRPKKVISSTVSFKDTAEDRLHQYNMKKWDEPAAIMSPWPFFNERGGWGLDASHHVLAGISSVGKAIAHSEPILCENGWKTHGTIEVGDKVWGPDGELYSVIGVHPQGKIPVFKITFSDRTSTICSKDHLWKVNNQVLTLDQISKDYKDIDYYIPVINPNDFKIKIPEQPPERKIVNIEPVGEEECTCISVDSKDHLYITRDYIVTHNTWAAIVTALYVAFDQNKRVLLLSKENGIGSIEDRLDAYYAKVPYGKRKEGNLEFRSYKEYYNALKKLKSMEGDVFINACNDINYVPEIHELSEKYDADMVIVDGAYLFTPTTSRNDQYQSNSGLVKEFQDACKSQPKTAWLTVVQLNPDAESTAAKETAYKTRGTKDWFINCASNLAVTASPEDRLANRIKVHFGKMREMGENIGKDHFYIRSDRVNMSFEQFDPESGEEFDDEIGELL